MDYMDLGYSEALEKYRQENNLNEFEVGRVIAEHKERYVIKTPDQEFDAELLGNLRYTANSRYDLPAVGDWVAFTVYDEGKALIHAIYPRKGVVERQAVGKTAEKQIIATNIDCGIIVQGVDRDFNINRLERYVSLCNSAGIQMFIVLNKIDLITTEDLQGKIESVNARIDGIQVIANSNLEGDYKELKQKIETGKTYCLLGSSGVGKSTILNGLMGHELMKTGEISRTTNKGTHTTSHRELLVLNSGGILIDNPGMRELGMTDDDSGLSLTFKDIEAYATECKYKDCTHVHEDGCAVLEAIDEGEIDEQAYANFRKMEKEKMHFESDLSQRKKKDKDLGKLIKNVKKIKKNTKY